MKILLVDDDPDLLNQAELFLERENEEFEVDTVSSPEEALDMIGNNEYTALVSDYQMPDMNGLELIKAVKEKRRNDIPFIVFTGKGREEVAMEAVNIGVDHYLQKGGDPKSQYAVLANVIEQCMDHYRSKRKLEKSERKYRAVFENTGNGTLIIEGDGTISTLNEKAADLIGLQKGEIEGEKWDEFLSKYNVEIIKSSLESIEKENQLFTDKCEISFENSEGQKRYFILSLNKIPETEKVIASFLDITERKEAEKEVKKEKNLLNSMLENFPASIYVKNRKGEHIQISRRLRRKLEEEGIEEIIGKTDREIYSEGREDLEEDLRIMKDEEPILRDLRHTEERDYYFLTSKAPFYDSDGEVAGIVGMTLNVTERERVKRELEFESHLLNSLLENIPDSIYFKDENNRYVRVSESKAEHLEVDPKEAIGKTDFDFYPDEQAESMAEDDKKVMETGEPIRRREKVKRPNGEELFVSVIKVPRYKDGEIVGTLGISREIRDENLSG